MQITLEIVNQNGEIVNRRFSDTQSVLDYIHGMTDESIIRTVQTPFLWVSELGYYITRPDRMPKRKWGEIALAWKAPHGTAYGCASFKVDQKGNLEIEELDWCHGVDDVVDELSKWGTVSQEVIDELFDSAPHDWRFDVENVKTTRILFPDLDIGFDFSWDMWKGEKPEDVGFIVGNEMFPIGRPISPRKDGKSEESES